MYALQCKVEELNLKYCVNTKNHLVVREHHGFYQVSLTGKTYYQGLKTSYFNITTGFQEEFNIINNLKQIEKIGWLQSIIKRYEFRT